MVTQPADVKAARELNVGAIRQDFPILEQRVEGRRLVYLDNAASSQKPVAVLDAIRDYYETSHANVHRGIHELSTRATDAYESSRARVAEHIGASDPAEIVFVRGTTEAINLVASSWGSANVGDGDEILLTVLEHHSNIVPWQILAQRVGAQLRYLDIDDAGKLRLEQLDDNLSERTKLVAVTHVSNGLGTINPIREIVDAAHELGALVMVDGAQAAPHFKPDMGELGADFYAFSGHKMCGPTGVGVLWGQRELLNAMPPYQGGGEMIEVVERESSTYKGTPHKFEAGTPNIAGAVGLAAAIDYLEGIGFEKLALHEDALIEYALDRTSNIEGFRDYGPRQDRAAVLSFNLEGVHPHDMAQFLDSQGIAVRAGHHCNQVLMRRLGVGSTTRASFYLYNDRDDVDALCDGLLAAREFFAGG